MTALEQLQLATLGERAKRDEPSRQNRAFRVGGWDEAVKLQDALIEIHEAENGGGDE